ALTSRASGGSGEATFYEPGLGACGRVNGPNDMIAAVAIGRGKGECGNRIRVSCGGKQIEVEIVDLCASCAPNDVDLSPIAFNQLADPDQGRVAITWEYV
ncbi:riboflavine-aldehyde-forming enzyme, partial [Tricharina praecox]|uniref:riboflavine-aldehyde-forming enzyme n=1 Tax=Tricharina praecox TaxID=43433 RepID=UPI00221EDBAE